MQAVPPDFLSGEVQSAQQNVPYEMVERISKCYVEAVFQYSKVAHPTHASAVIDIVQP